MLESCNTCLRTKETINFMLVKQAQHLCHDYCKPITAPLVGAERGIMTQSEMIIDYLKTHPNGLTPQDAVSLFGCMRLSGRIFDLKSMGYPIATEMETKKNRYGRSVTYARYKLVTEDKSDNS